MTIDEAARATRAYFRSGKAVLTSDGTTVTKRITGDEAQAACDRLNLIAVLEAIMEPIAFMRSAGDTAFENGYVEEVFTAMIDALITEVKEQQNA